MAYILVIDDDPISGEIVREILGWNAFSQDRARVSWLPKGGASGYGLRSRDTVLKPFLRQLRRKIRQQLRFGVYLGSKKSYRFNLP
jgi:hypothetical protein